MNTDRAVGMPSHASSLLRALHAESLKLRGTLVLWMSVVAPGLVGLVVVLQLLVNPPNAALQPLEAWTRLCYGMLGLWAFLMLPLFVTLEAALLAALEHGGQKWRHLLALPLRREAYYLAKLIMLAALLAIAHLCFFLLLPIGGWLLAAFQPKLGIAGPPPWPLLAMTAGKIFAASLLIVALHTWIALRWRSFAVACGIGMGMTVMGFLIGQSKTFGPWYPWSLPVSMMSQSQDHLPQVLMLSIGGALLVTALGLWEFRRAEYP